MCTEPTEAPAGEDDVDEDLAADLRRAHISGGPAPPQQAPSLADSSPVSKGGPYLPECPTTSPGKHAQHSHTVPESSTAVGLQNWGITAYVQRIYK